MKKIKRWMNLPPRPIQPFGEGVAGIAKAF
jgi:hypothetical protein